MKTNFEDYLHQIDSSFSEKTQKDIYMIYIMIFSAIFAFSYLLFWDMSYDQFEQNNKNIASIKQKITDDKQYLLLNPESKITILENEIKNIETDMLVMKDNNAYIKSQIETISSLIYDEVTWGEYLHSISKNARTYGISIKNLTNTYALNNQSFGHILNIKMKSDGSFNNTMKFLNSLEQSDLVVDIHALSIKAQNKLDMDLKISVWGITY